MFPHTHAPIPLFPSIFSWPFLLCMSLNVTVSSELELRSYCFPVVSRAAFSDPLRPIYHVCVGATPSPRPLSASCVTLGELLQFSAAQFPYLSNAVTTALPSETVRREQASARERLRRRVAEPGRAAHITGYQRYVLWAVPLPGALQADSSRRPSKSRLTVFCSPKPSPLPLVPGEATSVQSPRRVLLSSLVPFSSRPAFSHPHN